MRVDRKVLARRLELLLADIDRAAGEELDGALARLVDSATVLLGVAGAGLMLLGERDTLRCVAASDRDGRALGTAQERLGDGPDLESFRRDIIVATPDLPADARWPDLRHLVDREAVRAMMSAPVRLPGEEPLGTVIGVLHVHASLPHDWDVAELSALAAYADVAASLVAMALLARVRGILLDRLLVALRPS
jgi:GAF domain-containing protein